MLVLSRKLGERIVIGDDVEVEIIQLSPGRVKLGITAPAKYKIMRTELLGKEPPPQQDSTQI